MPDRPVTLPWEGREISSGEGMGDIEAESERIPVFPSPAATASDPPASGRVLLVGAFPKHYR